MLQDKLIDYSILGKACKYYESLGFTQIEVPWIVNRVYMEITSPVPGVGCAIGLENGQDYLVCSAEHGFIRQALLCELKERTPFYAVSPCFRDEIRDETHSTWFMKMELFELNTERRCKASAYKWANFARDFYANECGIRLPYVMETDIGWDVMFEDLELGSYGVRQLMGREWCAYGTGVALPRVSLAQERS